MDAVEVERYDPYNKSWCAISPALKYVSNFAAASCLGKLYLVGSCAVKYNALTLQCYNPVQGESWLHRRAPPTPPWGAGLRGTPRQVTSCAARHGPMGSDQVLMASGNGCGTGPGASWEHGCRQHRPESQTSSTAWT